jgi:phage gpG-like protein
MIEQSLDVSVMRRKLRALSDLGFLTRAMDGIADELSARVANGFRDQKDPWGTPWLPLRPSTIRARRKGKGGGSPQILRDQGLLQKVSIAQRVDPLTIEFGSNLRYAAVHQFGADVSVSARRAEVRLRTVKNANGKRVTRFAKKSHKRVITKWGVSGSYRFKIPARPFLPIRKGNVVSLPAEWFTAIQRRLDAAAARAARGDL